MDTVERDKLEEESIWAEYLAHIRNLKDDKYEEVEPWAWSILQRRLKNFRAKVRRRERRAA